MPWGVHSGYEDEMIAYGYQHEGLNDLLETEIKCQKSDVGEKIKAITSGADAARRLIELVAARARFPLGKSSTNGFR